VADDRSDIGLEDRVVVVIENDENFSRFLVDVAHEHGFKGLIASTGAEGIALAHQFKVDAITLDIQLPVIDGWRVLERLKGDFATRHIPVFVITTEEETSRGLLLGAVGALNEPIKTKEALDEVFVTLRGFLDRRARELLVVSRDGSGISAVAEVAGDASVRKVIVSSGLEALGALDERTFDCVVVEPRLGEMESIETTAEILRQCSARRIPAILYTPFPVSEEIDRELARISHGAIVKTVRSPERLLDQISLFLHSSIGQLPAEQRKALETLYSTDAVLAGKKVLLVDDDIRNIFAMTSVLERQNMQVFSAETGKEAIEKLESTGIDIVLMDLMMPGMDGYDTMREIRKNESFRSLPIIAVTAKAMKGDREKTLQAGAWDYLAKPVDTDQMLSVLRAWLYR